MIGGFLGAGKTTAILKFAGWLANTRKLKAALITNDQANGLVDTALANGARFEVREIGGGCFCCRSGVLVEAMRQFSETVKPDVVIGEPVGSCTDLVATVLGPLRSIYKTDYRLGPLSVMVDPFRAERLLEGGAAGNGAFSGDVNYIYRKQLEEAEIIVVNKCDVFAPKRAKALCAALREQFPKAEVLKVSVRSGEGLAEWWERVLTRTHASEGSMEVDYGVYADGEARLGWVNGEYEISLTPGLKRAGKGRVRLKGDRVLESVVDSIKTAFRAGRIEVAHLKLALLAGENGERQLGAIQWVRTESEPEFTQRLTEPFTRARLLLNLRAEAEPEFLTETVEQAFASIQTQVRVKRLNYSAFKPSPPTPTHRMGAAVDGPRKTLKARKVGEKGKALRVAGEKTVRNNERDEKASRQGRQRRQGKEFVGSPLRPLRP